MDIAKKTKVFYVDFSLLIAYANGRLIHILNGKDMTVLRTLKSHRAEIICLDVAPLKKRIFSAEEGVVFVHQMVTPKISDTKCFQQSLTLGGYNWVLKFKVEIGFPDSLLLSPCSYIGDLFVALYPQSFSVWHKVPGKNFENLICYYSNSDAQNSPAKLMLKRSEEETYSYMEISPDCRLLAILSDKSLRIWFHHLYIKATESKETEEFGLANIQLIHEAPILSFKFKHHNYFEVVSKIIPNLIITCTEDKRFHLWLENFSLSSIEFYEFEIINDFVDKPLPSFHFIKSNHKNEYYNYQREDVMTTKLINPHLDHTFFLLKDRNQLGFVKPNYSAASLDCLCFITPEQICVYKIEGVRNFPIGSILVYVSLRVVNSQHRINSIYQFEGLLSIVGSPNSSTELLLYGFNREGFLLSWVKPFGQKVDRPCRIDSIFVHEKGVILNRATHPQLPLYLTVSEYSNHQILQISYIQKKTTKHCGYFVPKDSLRYHVKSISWIDYLPLFILITQEGHLKVCGPEIESLKEDVPSYLTVLEYSVCPQLPLMWKCYFSCSLDSFSLNGTSLLHIQTQKKLSNYTERFLLFSETSIDLCKLQIENSKEPNNLVIELIVEENGDFVHQGEFRELALLGNIINNSFDFCVRERTHLDVFHCTISPFRFTKYGEIPCGTTSRLRISRNVPPLIVTIDSSSIIRLYDASTKYMGFLNGEEIGLLMSDKSKIEEKELKSTDVGFVHFYDISALLLLIDRSLYVLPNNYMYEPSKHNYSVKDSHKKELPYNGDIPVQLIEQIEMNSREQQKRQIFEIFKMHPIYHPKLLTEYMCHGEIKKIGTILSALYKELREDPDQSPHKLRMFLGVDMEELISKIGDSQGAKSEEEEESNSLFDDLMFGGKKEEVKIKSIIGDFSKEPEFQEILQEKEKLIELIKKSEALALNEEEVAELIAFVSNLKELMAYQKAEDDIAQEFLLHVNVCNIQMKKEDHASAINTMDVVLAYHCQNQDIILRSTLPQDGTYTWKDLKQFGIPLWLKALPKLYNILEEMVKTEFQRSTQKMSDRVDDVSMWYVMLNKKTVLGSFYKNIPSSKNIFTFLGHDFTDPRWIKAASHNAFALVSSKRYNLAIAFYLLGRHIDLATQVAIRHLNDLQLAITICRMMEGDQSETLMQIYQTYFIDKGVYYDDPWLTSFGYWLRNEYIKSLNCILEYITHEDNIVKSELDPYYNLYEKDLRTQSRKLSDTWSFESPVLSSFNASMIVLCKKLEKHYLITTTLKKNEKKPKVSVQDSIFDAFMEAPSEKVEEEKEESTEEKLLLDINKLILKGCEMYSKARLPLLALHLMKGETGLLQSNREYVTQIVKAVLRIALMDLLKQALLVPKDIREKIISMVKILEKSYNVPAAILKQQVLETLHDCDKFEASRYKILSTAEAAIILYWHIEEGEVLTALAMIQKCSSKLAEFVHDILINPFSYQLFNSDKLDMKMKEKMLTVLGFIERLIEMIGLMEAAYEDESRSPKQIQREEFLINFNKLKFQAQIIIYTAFIIILIEINKYSQTTILMAQLSVIFQDKEISWRKVVSAKLEKVIYSTRKSLESGKQKFLSSAKLKKLLSPHQIDPKKGSYFFALWCRYIIMRKMGGIFKIYQDAHRTEKSPLSLIKVLTEKDKAQLKDPSYISYYNTKSFSLFQVSMFLDLTKTHILEMQLELSKYAFFYLNHIMSSVERVEVYNDIEKIFVKKNPIEGSKYLRLQKFFKTDSKLLNFNKFFLENGFHIKELKTHIISSSHFFPNETVRGGKKESAILFSEGIEMYKGKMDTIHGFAVNRLNPEQMVIAMKKGTREIQLKHCLEYRERTVDGQKLLDDEFEEFDKVLNRFKRVQKEYDDKINSPVIEAMVSKFTSRAREESSLFSHFESVTVLEWNYHNAEEYYLTVPKEERNHNEVALTAASHPHLSIYATGSTQGRIQFWRFNDQNTSQAIAEYYTSSKWKENTSSSSSIVNLKFNHYGDTFGAIDKESNFYLFQYDLFGISSEPALSYGHRQYMDSLDFCFLNQGSVVCTVGRTPSPHLLIIDTLIPQSRSVVLNEPLGGNIILPLHENQQLLLFDSNEKGMKIFDIRMRKQFEAFLIEEQTTAATLNLEENALVTGHPDGSIAIWNVYVGFSLKERLPAFEGSKGVIKQVEFTSDNTLYGCTSDGIVKLLKCSL